MITWNRILFSFPARDSIANIVLLHDFLFIILRCILLLVFFNFYYSYVSSRFNLSFSENHFLEFAWTVFPFFILSFVIFTSVSALYYSDSCFFCGISVIIIGHQWYWTYIFKDFDDYFFDSYMIPNFARGLDTDNRLILPFNVPVRVIVRSADVIHSWTVPSLGVKIDCIPGRLNQRCFSFNRCGIFFGQCSEICGINHSFIPIRLEVLNFTDFFSCFLSNILSLRSSPFKWEMFSLIIKTLVKLYNVDLSDRNLKF